MMPLHAGYATLISPAAMLPRLPLFSASCSRRLMLPFQRFRASADADAMLIAMPLLILLRFRFHD